MPFVRIKESPLLPGITPVKLHYRECGSGMPLVFLHGGWGYSLYPLDRQITALRERCRIMIPDRSGYGRSVQRGMLPVDFHQRAATDMWHFLDALAVERCVLWGHSDGAVIAALMALDRPKHVFGVILADAGHSPHSHRAAAIECNRIVVAFLRTAIDPQALP